MWKLLSIIFYLIERINYYDAILKLVFEYYIKTYIYKNI